MAPHQQQSSAPRTTISISESEAAATTMKACPTPPLVAAVTTGELYYKLAKKNPTLAFPSGICPKVGLSGQINGGGWGTLLWKYGLAADSVVDALLIDAEGRLLDRASMGEDLFWAIRGGGGNTFGIVVAWKS
ncbi:O-acetylstemmadenine oxidase [Linum perenne]